MTAQFVESIRQHAIAASKMDLPSFLPMPDDSGNPRIALISARQDLKVSHFVMFGVTDRRESFTVDVGWSCSGAFPWTTRYGRPLDDSGAYAEAAVTGTAFRCRLDRLWGSRRDHWWGNAKLTIDEGLELLQRVN